MLPDFVKFCLVVVGVLVMFIGSGVGIKYALEPNYKCLNGTLYQQQGDVLVKQSGECVK